jgi:hypothetical protein
VNDQPDREVAPFCLPGIRLSASESVEMEAIFEKRWIGQIWRELSLEQGRREQYVSREFMVQNTDGTMRGVANLSHLLDHYDSIATNAETLEGFSASFDVWGSNALYGFAQRVQSFQAASGYAEIFYCEDSDGRWHRALFSVSCASIWIEPFWLLVLEISAEILDYGQEDARLSCFELCRRLRDCSISRPQCIIGRLSKSVAAFGRAAFALWFDKARFKGCLGRWVLVSTTSRPCGGYSPRVACNPGEEVGCDFELCPAVSDEGATQPQAREGGLSGKFYRQSSEYATGRARHGVPPQSPFRLHTPQRGRRLRCLYFSWATMPDFHSYCAFIASGFERSGILERSSQPATSPSYLARVVKTDCKHSYRRFYDGMLGDFSS